MRPVNVRPTITRVLWLADRMLDQRALVALLLSADCAALKTANDACIAESSDGLCPLQQGGAPIGEWDVSAVTAMYQTFYA